jgi:site-specific DNA-methyltransferase (adenine-specific)
MVRLILGDCLEVMKTLPDKSVDAVITDPPYGIAFQSAWRIDKNEWRPKIANDTKPFTGWLRDAFRITAEAGCLICFCRWDVQEDFRKAIVLSGWSVKSQIVWDRMCHGMGDLSSAFAPQHDVMWFGIKGEFAFPGARPVSVFRDMRVAPDKLVHPNEKPVSLMRALSSSVARRGGVVFDPFMGSGTTGVACVQAGRDFIGIEIDQGYFSIAERRIKEAGAQGMLFD